MKYSDSTWNIIASSLSHKESERQARVAVVYETTRALALSLPRSLYPSPMMQDSVCRPAAETAQRIKELTDRKVREAREVIEHAI